MEDHHHYQSDTFGPSYSIVMIFCPFGVCGDLLLSRDTGYHLEFELYGQHWHGRSLISGENSVKLLSAVEIVDDCMARACDKLALDTVWSYRKSSTPSSANISALCSDIRSSRRNLISNISSGMGEGRRVRKIETIGKCLTWRISERQGWHHLEVGVIFCIVAGFHWSGLMIRVAGINGGHVKLD
uniref:Uncharacterized protein n=1 Tax=Cannabis sativa TaxID=3483 RepID=A0A803P7F9_CANSA